MTAPVAEKAVKAKVSASQGAKKAATSTARAGEKSARTAADREARLQRVNAAKARVDAKKKVSESPKQKPSTTQRAVSSTKSASKRRVESAKQSQKKTSTAVESKYRKDRVLGLAEMRPKTRMLAAEYMAAVVMAVIMLFLHNDEKSYHQRMSRFFIQMTGITGIFFVLSLAASSEKASRYVIPFGLLIDVSMLVYLFKQGGANVIDAALGSSTTDYGEILHNEEAAHPSPPTLIAPGLIVTPGNVGVIGGNLGSPVQNPGVIITPGNKSVLTPGGGGTP